MDQTTEDLQPAVDGFKPLASPLTGPEPYDTTGELMKKLPKYTQNLFVACGYERSETIAKITPADIDAMLKYVQDNFSDDKR